MSDRPKRSNPDLYSLDYGTFHRTGEKVYKQKQESEMDSKSLKIKEKQIVDDIDEFFFLSSLEEMDTSDEVQNALDSIAQLSKEYRHLHIQLQEELGKEDYGTEYAEFDTLLGNIRKYQKDGKVKLKSILKSQNDSLATNDLLATTRIQLDEEKEKERLDNETRVRKSILVEEEVFQEKLKMEIIDFELTSISSVERHYICFEHFLDDCFQLLSKAKIAFSEDYEKECKDMFEKTLTEIRD